MVAATKKPLTSAQIEQRRKAGAARQTPEVVISSVAKMLAADAPISVDAVELLQRECAAYVVRAGAK